MNLNITRLLHGSYSHLMEQKHKYIQVLPTGVMGFVFGVFVLPPFFFFFLIKTEDTDLELNMKLLTPGLLLLYSLFFDFQSLVPNAYRIIKTCLV